MKLLIALAVCASISFSTGVNAQSDDDFYKELSAAGYKFNETFSFKKTKQKMAMTALLKSKDEKDPMTFLAQISPSKDGAIMFFRGQVNCTPTPKSGALLERVITVNTQKIEVYYSCGYASGASRTNEVYLIKSPEGQDYVQQRFTEERLVFVRLNGLPIPFDTDGFYQALSEYKGKAL